MLYGMMMMTMMMDGEADNRMTSEGWRDEWVMDYSKMG